MTSFLSTQTGSESHFFRHCDLVQPQPAPSRTDSGALTRVSVRLKALGLRSRAVLSCGKTNPDKINTTRYEQGVRKEGGTRTDQEFHQKLMRHIGLQGRRVRDALENIASCPKMLSLHPTFHNLRTSATDKGRRHSDRPEKICLA